MDQQTYNTQLFFESIIHTFLRNLECKIASIWCPQIWIDMILNRIYLGLWTFHFVNQTRNLIIQRSTADSPMMKLLRTCRRRWWPCITPQGDIQCFTLLLYTHMHRTYTHEVWLQPSLWRGARAKRLPGGLARGGSWGLFSVLLLKGLSCLGVRSHKHSTKRKGSRWPLYCVE